MSQFLMEQNDNSVLVVSGKIPKNETLLVTVGPVKIPLISSFNHAISSFFLAFQRYTNPKDFILFSNVMVHMNGH